MDIIKDRLIFDKVQLDNGITIYFYPKDVPFADVRISIPFGHIHNTGRIKPGAAHFLEHLVASRSHRFPKRYQFSKHISLKGGDFNAETNLQSSDFRLVVPANIFTDSFTGFISQVFEPLFTDEDIRHEAGIIRNERQRRGPWWPGGDKLGNYLYTKWRFASILALEDELGTDESLRSFTVADMRDLHKYYFSSKMRVLVGGTYDKLLVCQEFSKLKTNDSRLQEHFISPVWNKKEFHEAVFPDINRYVYRIGGIENTFEFDRFMALSFLFTYLTNTVHGPIYDWLRHEKGQVYDIEFSIERLVGHVLWSIVLPFSTREHAQEARKDLLARIKTAVQDRDGIAAEFERRINQSLFYFQTLSSILDAADESLYMYGFAYTEHEVIEILRRSCTPEFLGKLAREIFSESNIGEFLAVPGHRS